MDDVSSQPSCYAMYGKEEWKINLEKLKLVECNLLSNQRAEFVVTEDEIANTRGCIRGSVADMHSLLVDEENNIPKDETFFKKVVEDKIRDKCNFRKVCV